MFEFYGTMRGQQKWEQSIFIYCSGNSNID